MQLQILQSVINQQEVNSINIRNVWKELGIRKPFSDWVKSQIDRTGLTEGTD